MSGDGSTNTFGIKTNNITAKKINNQQIFAIQNVLKQTITTTSSGHVTGITDKFKNIIIDAVADEIAVKVIKKLCDNYCLSDDCCYYLNGENCCGDNQVRNLNNTIFQTINNNLMFTDENFSILDTEIIEDIENTENVSNTENTTNTINIENSDNTNTTNNNNFQEIENNDD